MSNLKIYCNAGCQKEFEVKSFKTAKLPDKVEKTYFNCPHCDHEYLVHYTDIEIRKLQARIRRVQKRFADPNDNHEDAARKEAEIQALIKEKMDALRLEVEGEGGLNG
ncbi:hypothetical protein EJP82_01350 [Paenibacillus anaericanus]|uniref:Transglycosylase n=2 Tax=Paenibacillus anaericanus TaxID=170367 RepID=A0A3S1BVR3_9BACL|nr:hypothetical protein EJP82_01350 [Paenibacillus anaericanus]